MLFAGVYVCRHRHTARKIFSPENFPSGAVKGLYVAIIEKKRYNNNNNNNNILY